MPPRPDEGFIQTFATAAEDLVASAASGEPHEVDLAVGTRVVDLLTDAQAQLSPAG